MPDQYPPARSRGTDVRPQFVQPFEKHMTALALCLLYGSSVRVPGRRVRPLRCGGSNRRLKENQTGPLSGQTNGSQRAAIGSAAAVRTATAKAPATAMGAATSATTRKMTRR